MNKVAEEMKSYIGSSEMSDEEFLQHYGMPRRSGRYPWGSGKDPYQHSIDFLGRIEMLRKHGWTENAENIRKAFGLSSTEYRREKTLCLNQRTLKNIATAEGLRKKGYSVSEIGRRMGKNESHIRDLLAESRKEKEMEITNLYNFIKDRVKKDKMIDVGKHAEIELKTSREKFESVLQMLESEGYGIYSNRIPQPTDKNRQTTQKVLCDKSIKPSPGKKIPKELYNYDQIKSLVDYTTIDNGKTFVKKFRYPESMDSKRIKVLTENERGLDGLRGTDKDGLIEIRRGVQDLNLGDSKYAQVRILVDGNKYLKGMAIYSDNIPDGYDIVVNSNKRTVEDAFKKIKDDPVNPFGASIKDFDKGGQYEYIDKKTGKKKLGLINKTTDQGDWTEWKDSLPSQFLSKQSESLAKKQLQQAKDDKIAEFESIKSLTNPTIKKYYLDKFASNCDKAAVDLKAAALPGQKYHVIIPVNAMGDKKIYAPKYANGTQVALIRYPHGGIFEIPILTVDNKNATARKLLGTDAEDVVGISKHNADRLSGADFDGDTVMVIPTNGKNGVKIAHSDELKELKGFDPKQYQYASTSVDKKGVTHYYDAGGREFQTMKNKDNEMGVISNLITDMTLQGGAPPEHLARAVKHSMVVIDAKKHHLDYKKSEIDNNIKELKALYQSSVDEEGNVHIGGSSTIISRAKGSANVPKRVGQPRINQKGKEWYDPSKEEGALIYRVADPKNLYYAESSVNKETNIRTLRDAKTGKKIEYDLSDKGARDRYDPVMKVNNKTGDVHFYSKDGTIEYRKVMRTTKTTKMAAAEDARDIMSNRQHPHPMEAIYADYANAMKSLANKARKELVYTKPLQMSHQAKRIYSKEVESLTSKLRQASRNAPKEREVLRKANIEIAAAREADPNMSKDDVKKLSQRIVSKYRDEVGTIKRRDRAINITDKEWDAIQAGAISDNKLKNILRYTDADALRERAMPKERKGLTTVQVNRIKSLAANGFTLKEIADKMHISVSAVSNYLKGAN